jgi:hypothetical protein
MLENGSFEHMLGYLILQAGPSDVEGLKKLQLNELWSRLQQIRQQARARNASWVSWRRSVRSSRRRRFGARRRSVRQPSGADPTRFPCSVSRRAITGSTPRFHTSRRYLSWS